MSELKSIDDLTHHIRKLARDCIVDIENVVIRDEKLTASNEGKLIYDGDLYFEFADPTRGPNRIKKVPFFVVGHFIVESDSWFTFEDPNHAGTHHHFRLKDFLLENLGN